MSDFQSDPDYISLGEDSDNNSDAGSAMDIEQSPSPRAHFATGPPMIAEPGSAYQHLALPIRQRPTEVTLPGPTTLRRVPPTKTREPCFYRVTKKVKPVERKDRKRVSSCPPIMQPDRNDFHDMTKPWAVSLTSLMVQPDPPLAQVLRDIPQWHGVVQYEDGSTVRPPPTNNARTSKLSRGKSDIAARTIRSTRGAHMSHAPSGIGNRYPRRETRLPPSGSRRGSAYAEGLARGLAQSSYINPYAVPPPPPPPPPPTYYQQQSSHPWHGEYQQHQHQQYAASQGHQYGQNYQSSATPSAFAQQQAWSQYNAAQQAPPPPPSAHAAPSTSASQTSQQQGQSGSSTIGTWPHIN